MHSILLLAMIASQQPREGAFWNIKNYGAVGDAVTDDTLAIRQVLDWAEANGGGIVHVPCGHFIVDCQGADCDVSGNNPILDIPSNTTVEGEGACSIIGLPTDFETHDIHPVGGGYDGNHHIIGALATTSDPSRTHITIRNLQVQGGFEIGDTCRATNEDSFGIFFYGSTGKLVQQSLSGAAAGTSWTSFSGGTGWGEGRPATVRIFDDDVGGELGVSAKVYGTDRTGASVTETTPVLDYDTDRAYTTSTIFTAVTKLEIVSIVGYEVSDSINLTVADPIQDVTIQNVISGSGGDPFYFGLGVVRSRIVDSYAYLYCRGGFTQGGAWSNMPLDVTVSNTTFLGHPGSTKFRSIDIETGSGPARGIKIINNRLDGDLEAGRCDDCRIEGNVVRGYSPNSDNERISFINNTFYCPIATTDEQGCLTFNGQCKDCQIIGNTIVMDATNTSSNKYGLYMFTAGTGDPENVIISGNHFVAKTATGFEKRAITIEGGKNITVIGNTITPSAQYGGVWYNGIYLDKVDGAIVKDNFADVTNSALKVMADIGPIQNVHIDGNVLDGNVSDLQLGTSGTCSTDVINVHVGTNVFKNATMLYTGSCAINGDVDVTIADNGVGTPATYTTSPSMYDDYVNLVITCSDVHGCTVTPGETGIKRTNRMGIVNVSANVVTVTDAAGVLRTPGGLGVALAQNERAYCEYENSIWVCR